MRWSLRQVVLRCIAGNAYCSLRRRAISFIRRCERICSWRPDATEQEPQRVLAAVCLTNLLEGLEQGLDTQPGEHGDLLSGGVRRRLSIARALLTLPDILLLDEPTAGVDGAIARQMLSTIRALLPESTIVVATHDSWLVTTAEQHIRLHTTANRTAMESIGGISKDLSDGLGVAL